MTDSVPENVKNPALYRSIRNRMRKEHSRASKRWGAYSSGQLVQEYKRRGGKYKNSKSRTKSHAKSRAKSRRKSRAKSRHKTRTKSHRKTQHKSGKLARWYKEKWVDACAYANGKIKQCGRKSIDSGKFPYCRPLKRITKSTPRTVKELSRSQIKRLCSRKRKNPKKIIRRRNSYEFDKSKKIKLISVKKSPKSAKKLRATFEVNGKQTHTDFGAAGMSDYTRHHDKERRSRYITRHKKDLRTNDPKRAGYLSMYVLWNKPTVKGSVADYRKRLAIYNRTGKFPTKIK